MYSRGRSYGVQPAGPCWKTCLPGSDLPVPAEGRVRVVDLGGLEHIHRMGRPGIFVAPHIANWNLLPLAATHSGIPLTVVYRRQSNPMIDARVAQGRSVGLLMDQRYVRGVAVAD